MRNEEYTERLIMRGKVEISHEGIVISHSGGEIILGGLGSPSAHVALPILTPEENLYGRDLCLLPSGWDDLSGDAAWLNYLGGQLKSLWMQMEREEKMAVAYAISELVDDMTSISIEAAGY